MKDLIGFGESLSMKRERVRRKGGRFDWTRNRSQGHEFA